MGVGQDPGSFWTAKEQKSFWIEENILYLSLGTGYMGICECQHLSSGTIQISEFHCVQTTPPKGKKKSEGRKEGRETWREGGREGGRGGETKKRMKEMAGQWRTDHMLIPESKCAKLIKNRH